MNEEPISDKERRKARAMVRDIARDATFNGQKMSADEWWSLIFAGAYGQEVVPNPFHQQFPSAPMFVIRNKKRTRDLNVSNGAELITALYAFGNEKGVEWSDPQWKEEQRFYEEERKRWANG